MRLRLIVASLAIAFLPSCMVGPNYVVPRAVVEDQWVERRAVSGKPYGEPEIFWWRNFHDSTLTRLVELAYANNLTLQSAGVRILQVRAELNRSIGNLFPQQQGVSGGLNYAYIPPSTGGSSSVGSTSPVLNALAQNINQQKPDFSIGPNLLTNQSLFSASWEIDFWGKFRRQIESDKAKYLSTVAAYDDALVTLIGDVATTYINIRTVQRQIAITQQNIELQKESFRIAQVRYQSGETSELDPSQAQTQLLQTQAQIPSLESSLRQLKNSLAVLIGQTPNTVDAIVKTGEIPQPPAKMVAGIPKDLLRRRPDVRQAGLNAAAKSALIGVQVANLLPAFSLSGTFGSSSSNIGAQQLIDIFNWQNAIVNAGGNIAMPVLNYGRLINQVRQQDAAFQEAALNYQNTVLTAQKDVENGLTQFYNGRASMAFLAQAVKSARTSTTLAISRYKAGQSDYTTVLSAEQAQLSVELNYANAQSGTVTGVVNTYRSLGGGWQIRNGGDVISDAVKKQMAERTNWGRMLKPQNHLPVIPPEDRPAESVSKNRPIWKLLNVNQ
ncbi:MAG: efflux transporter outer membrane subunit [Terrimicrobiaceae bacterium]